MKGLLNLLALAALLSASGVSQATTPSPDQDALAQDILANLEFNTFPNSLRPMHFPDGTTLGETPHHIVEKVQAEQTTWRAVDEERSWMYAVTIIRSGPEGVTICFRDRSFVGSYRATAPLVVQKNASGHYLVVEELSGLPGCPQTKG